MLSLGELRNPPIHHMRLLLTTHEVVKSRRIEVLPVGETNRRYGPGVRSTAASAVAASASRIAAPSRALDRART